MWSAIYKDKLEDLYIRIFVVRLYIKLETEKYISKK